MLALKKDQRNLLAKVVLQARELAEAGSRKALHTLGVDESDAPGHLTPDQRILRRALRAQARQLGDREDPAKKGQYLIRHLVEKIAYDQWHRLLFARFLAENDLLISPQHGVGVSLEDCGELAPELGLRDGWEVAARFAAQMLPQIFRADDPAGQIRFAPEDRTALQQLVTGLPRDTFLADDGLGWVYQFWQAQRKEEVNKSEVKIGADELSPVTQLFTEDYMVLFLLHNTLGAWWAGKRMEGITAAPEEEARAAVALPGVSWEYLRFVRDEQTGAWRPAAGTFDGWPKTAKELRLLDPCMGSGHFLVFAFLILVALRMVEEGLSQEEACTAVLRDNLFGLELDPRCTQIAAFNLALAAWKLGGYGPLPPLHLACCGLSLDAKREDWLKLAEHAAQSSSLAPERDLLGSGDNLLTKQLRFAMGALYDLFQKAPVLGSLINPRRDKAVTYATAFHELQPLLEQALKSESTDETIHELAVTAQGMAKAAEILAGQFTLVATNVPYLGRGKQDEVLREFCERYHADAKADLATCFVARCLEFCAPGGTTALVTPQNWLFLGTYKKLRERLLGTAQWDVVARLGPKGFQTPMWDFNIVLVALTHGQPGTDHALVGLDVAEQKTPLDKEAALRAQAVVQVSQKGQFKNPDSKVMLSESNLEVVLSRRAASYQGIKTGDDDRVRRFYWELETVSSCWRFFQSTTETTELFGGLEGLINWADDGNGLARRQGLGAWGKRGVMVSQMSDLPVALYYGEAFDSNASPIIPSTPTDMPALWAFCSAPEYREEVRKVDQSLKPTNTSLVQVPFDLAHWQRIAAEKYPNGLPKPHSDDPTQWLFSGYPKGSEQPLQVALARLLGYRWTRQTGSSFPDCPALGPDGLEPFADQDGIVCISAIKGEQPAAERLRALLAAAYGPEWNASRQAELLAQVGAKSLEDWLRHSFFEQHCQLFHQRPFIWHIWDGRRDGFSALVNYHQLKRAALEKLIYTYLGDWLTRQRAAVEAGEEGSDAKLAAALELKANLEKILEGEGYPEKNFGYDIFIRWKPLEAQPIGWAPDLNDGVRLNIRPFVTAGVLRKNPKIHWNKDRGKDVPSAPWFKVFKGERINDHHLRLEEKRK